MTDEHRTLRAGLGAYVLGALESDERRDVEEHLRHCQECTAELTRLSGLPGLLGRVTEEELSSGRLIPPEDLAGGVLERLSGAERTLRHRVRRWRAATAAAVAVAVLAAVLAIAPWDTPPDRLLAPVDPVAAEAAGTTGRAAAIAWEWGTTVELDVAGLPDRDVYQLWAVGSDGRRERAGTWGATASHEARVRGASSIARSQLQRVEVTGPEGTVLLAFDF